MFTFYHLGRNTWLGFDFIRCLLRTFDSDYLAFFKSCVVGDGFIDGIGPW